MKTALIIPIYKQSRYWIRLMDGIERQSVLPECVYVMMDRPTEKEYEYVKRSCESENVRNKYKVYNENKLPNYVGRPNDLPDQDLFFAGNMRNLAIDRAIEDGCDSFVFIDGDCVPEKDLIKAHENVASNGVPSLSCGRRRDIIYNWKDQREIDPALNALDLFNNDTGFIIQKQRLLDRSAITWSCNLGLNIQAIKLLKKLNKKYYGRSEVFCSEFSGTWGGEDGFLGIQANVCNIFINIISEEKSGIRHINHPRPESKYDEMNFEDYLEKQIYLLNEMQINNPLTINFFKIP